MWGHATLKQNALDEVMNGPRMRRGSAHQFGAVLGHDHLYSVGLGPARHLDNRRIIDSRVFPDRVVTGERTNVNIAGLDCC